MMTDRLRHQLIVADRTRDIDVIKTIVDDMLVEHPELSPLDLEIALRDAAAQAYLVVASHQVKVVLGMPAWKTALADAGITPDANRAALAAITPGK